MGITAVFIVPNNQSQEFIVTQCDDDGYPSYVYDKLEHYDTEVKARKLCKLSSFVRLEDAIEDIDPSDSMIKAKSTRFSYGYGGLRILLRRPEFTGRDYYYLFSKGRWLWADDFNRIIDFVKDGSLTMCDELIEDFESDITQFIGNPLKLDEESDEYKLYKKIVTGKGFLEFFHRLVQEYDEYFENSSLCYFYKPWIQNNEKGVSEIVRMNLVKNFKRKGQLTKFKESSVMSELEIDSISDRQLLKMSDDEFNDILKKNWNASIGEKDFSYEEMKDILNFYKKECINIAKDFIKNNNFNCDLYELEDVVKLEVTKKINEKFNFSGDHDSLCDLFDKFDEEPETILGILSRVKHILFRRA